MFESGLLSRGPPPHDGSLNNCLFRCHVCERSTCLPRSTILLSTHHISFEDSQPNGQLKNPLDNPPLPRFLNPSTSNSKMNETKFIQKVATGPSTPIRKMAFYVLNEHSHATYNVCDKSVRLSTFCHVHGAISFEILLPKPFTCL